MVGYAAVGQGGTESFLFGHEEGLDDRVHLMHIGAGPHDPHADGGDDYRHQADPG